MDRVVCRTVRVWVVFLMPWSDFFAEFCSTLFKLNIDIYSVLFRYRLKCKNATHYMSQCKLARSHTEEEGAVFLISHHSIVEIFQYWLFYFVDAVFSVDSFSPAAGCIFLFFCPPALGLLFANQNPSPFFLTHNALEGAAQPQFAYRGPQGTVKPFTCEYLTNQQITCWQGETRRG